MNTESLIFDIDGTLWDSRARVAEGYNIQLKAEGLDHLCVTKDDLTPLFGKVLTAIADSILASVPKEARYGMMQRLMDTENEHLVRMPCDFGYPNVKQTMERLSKKHRLFIVSNSQCGYPDICIEKLGLTGLIEGHLCFGDTGTEKGETIRRLMKEHKIQSAAYIGDTQGDLDAAAAAGIPFIFASYGFGNPTHWDAKIEKFEDLLAL